MSVTKKSCHFQKRVWQQSVASTVTQNLMLPDEKLLYGNIQSAALLQEASKIITALAYCITSSYRPIFQIIGCSF